MMKLKQRREALKLTQARVAMLAGVSERTLSGHERGEGRRCPYPAREAIARVLGIKVASLFDERGVAL